MKHFDPSSATLTKGISLVEASAGTGKTYAISMLVLRLVGEKNINIDQILVVTYTRAATEELRDRIRKKILEGCELLQGTLQAPDQTMMKWAERIIEKGKKQEILGRLSLALADIDLLAVYTIHGFCQRMLRDQAMESGQLFDVRLMKSIEEMEQDVAEDYWRETVYGLPALSCATIVSDYSSPVRLRERVGRVGSSVRIVPEVDDLWDCVTAYEESCSLLKGWFKEYGTSFYEAVISGIEGKKFKSGFAAGFEDEYRKLEAFVSGTLFPAVDQMIWLKAEYLIGQFHGTYVKKDVQQEYLETFPLPEKEFKQVEKSANDLKLSFKIFYARQLNQQLEQRMNRDGILSFDALIQQLAGAARGENKNKLQELFEKKFAAALIDEFQDTDTTQWDIFHTFFGQKKHYLYLIGDPKQAIYRFRGADIYSYFEARTAADNTFTLEKNFRSNPVLVDEVNHLFSNQKNPFVLGDGLIEYIPVKAEKDGTSFGLNRNKKALDPVVYCTLPAGSGKNGTWLTGTAEEQFLKYMVQEISRLLSTSEPVEMIKGGRQRLLRPKDIAILVRSHFQAMQCKEILSAGSIPAVINSNLSVFATRECRDLYGVLRGIANPGNVQLLKAAMAISWFGLTGNQIHDIFNGNDLLDQWLYDFHRYYQLWKEQSLLSMMSRLFEEKALLVNMCSESNPDRTLTNILHLCELVQQIEVEQRFSVSRTVQWLGDMYNNPDGNEAGELRLESDEDAVQIVTMHSSKGLEYPVVFCPYLWKKGGRPEKEQNCLVFHDKNKNLTCDFGSAEFEENRIRTMEEEAAEDVRLLYVALTRASMRNYIMWGDVSGKNGVSSFDSSLGMLLFSGTRQNCDQQNALFAEKMKREGVKHILLDELEKYGDSSPGVEQKEQPAFTCRKGGQRSLKTSWQVSSYSALNALSEKYQRDDTDILFEKVPATIFSSSFPKGAAFGNVVHDCLERQNFEKISRGEVDLEMIDKSCLQYGVNVESEKVARLLREVVLTDLLAGPRACSFSLSDLSSELCLKELEFYFHVSEMTTSRINRVLEEEEGFLPLAHKEMQGYLTGFIDLVFQYNGKYYVADYKTNYLGDEYGDYGYPSLVEAMTQHNYGLQLWIYSLVLHTYLQNVVPDYRHESHFGGAFYLFVRGMNPQIPGSGVYYRMPELAKLEKLQKITTRK